MGRQLEHGQSATGAALMELKWTSKGLSDLARLYDFLAAVNPVAAARVVQSLTAAPSGLRINPRIGERLEEFDQREVRRILVGNYEKRYEIQGALRNNNYSTNSHLALNPTRGEIFGLTAASASSDATGPANHSVRRPPWRGREAHAAGAEFSVQKTGAQRRLSEVTTRAD